LFLVFSDALCVSATRNGQRHSTFPLCYPYCQQAVASAYVACIPDLQQTALRVRYACTSCFLAPYTSLVLRSLRVWIQATAHALPVRCVYAYRAQRVRSLFVACMDTGHSACATCSLRVCQQATACPLPIRCVYGYRLQRMRSLFVACMPTGHSVSAPHSLRVCMQIRQLF